MAPDCYQLPLRWGDMDAQGHINNVAYIDYFQELRTKFVLSGPLAYLLRQGIVVVSHHITYRKAIKFSTEPITGEVGVSQVGGALFDLAYRLVKNRETICEAVTRLCPFDFNTQLPKRLTKSERDWLASKKVDFVPSSPIKVDEVEGGLKLDFPVRWSDIDSYGHVNNVKVFDYLQEARVALTEKLDPTLIRGSENNFNWVVVAQTVKYVNQITYRLENYQAKLAPTRLGNSSLTLASEIVDPLDEHKTLVQAATVLVCVDAKTGKPNPIPKTARQALAKISPV